MDATDLFLRLKATKLLKHQGIATPNQGEKLTEQQDNKLIETIDNHITDWLARPENEIIDLKQFESSDNALEYLQLLSQAANYRASARAKDVEQVIAKFEKIATENKLAQSDFGMSKVPDTETPVPEVPEVPQQEVPQQEVSDPEVSDQEVSDQEVSDPELCSNSAEALWKEHKYACPEADGVRLLWEERTRRKSNSPYARDGFLCNYGVEKFNRKKNTFYREIVGAGAVSSMLEKFWKDANALSFDVSAQDFDKKRCGKVTKFHWFAYRPLKSADQELQRRLPTVKCCVEFELMEGLHIILFSNLKKLMNQSTLNAEMTRTGERDGQPPLKDKQPKKWSEKNLAYDDPDEDCKSSLEVPKETYRQMKERTYREMGLSVNNGLPTPGHVVSNASKGIEHLIDQKLHEEKARINARFEKIEGTISGFQERLDSNGRDLKMIIHLLQNKTPISSQEKNTVPLSTKLHDALKGKGAARGETPAPPYDGKHTDPVANQSIEV